MKLGFASPHSILDSTSGAAIATLRMLSLLSSRGHRSHAFCPSHLDSPQELLIEQWLAESGLYYEVKKHRQFSMIHTEKADVKIDLFRSESTRRQWIDMNELKLFLGAFGCFLEQFKPDVLITYGGDPVALTMMRIAKSMDVPIVFYLHNFAYTDTTTFELVDHILVPSHFSRRHYQENLDLQCHCIPNVIDFDHVKIEQPDAKFLTFVNPEPVKGLLWFVRIAQELARLRPDIPVLVVEGRNRQIDLRALPNVTLMPNTADPREFYCVSRLILMPSVWNESFGLVAAEAMVNGIPVIASDRGALPEIIGDGGCLLNIPATFTEHTTEIPPADVVRPWVNRLICLWDDDQERTALSALATRRALHFHPDTLAPQFEQFFREVTSR